MSGMRTHMEVAAKMLKDYGAELDFVPGLLGLLSSRPNAEAYCYGAAFADWTNAVATVAELIDSVKPDVADRVAAVALAMLRQALDAVEQGVLPPVLDDKWQSEPEHWQPFTKRLAALLRTELTGKAWAPDDQRRIAFMLGIGCHEIQDIGFHFVGDQPNQLPDVKWLQSHPVAASDTVPGFATLASGQDAQVLAYGAQFGRAMTHPNVEFLADFTFALKSAYLRSADDVVQAVQSLKIEGHVQHVYAQMEIQPPVTPEDVAKGRNVVDQYLHWVSSSVGVGSASEPIAAALMEVMFSEYFGLFQRDSDTLFRGAVGHAFRGGLDNGAAVSFMNTLRWFATLRGYFYFQNEFRSNSDREAATYPVAGSLSNPVEERKYMPYSGVVDRTMGEVLDTKGQLNSPTGPVATLLRFEMADNADDTRNIPPSMPVSQATLRLWCSASPAPDSETKFGVYRVRTPWGWGRGPEPGKASGIPATVVPTSVVGTAGVNWTHRNCPLAADIYTQAALDDFREQLVGLGSELQDDLGEFQRLVLDIQSAIKGAAKGEQVLVPAAVPKLVRGLQTKWENATIPLGRLTFTLEPKDLSTIHQQTRNQAIVSRLFGDLNERLSTLWSDALNVLNTHPGAGGGIDELVTRLDHQRQAFSNWFASFDAVLQAPSYGWAKWEQLGCSGAADRSADPDVTFTVPASVGDGAWVECDVTRLVAAWVKAPEENFGMLIKREGGPKGVTIGYVQAHDSLLHQQRTSGIDVARTPMLIVF